jgi:Homeodomain-like domain
MAVTKPHKTSHPPAYKPLTIEQQNAIEGLILGQSDRDAAAAVGVSRETVWHWRHEHPVFMATLERRRAEVWRAPQEQLRSLMSKAVANVAAAVERGDLKASIEVLKAVGMYGNGTMNVIHEQDPEQLIAQEAERRVRREGLSADPTRDMLLDMTTNPAYQRRLAEVTAELYQEYGEAR